MARPKKRPEEGDETQSVSIRFPASLKNDAVALADADSRSFNFVVVRALEEWVERERAKKRASR